VNGSETDPYNKMVADVHERKYDVAVAAVRCISERVPFVDFTYLLHTSKYVLSVTYFAEANSRMASKPLHCIISQFSYTNFISMCLLS
jgi:hypothetical protein